MDKEKVTVTFVEEEAESCGCGCGCNGENEKEGHECACAGSDEQSEGSEEADFGPEEEHPTINLVLDDGTEKVCVVIDIFEVEGYEGKEYIALVPEGEEDVYLYEYKEFEESQEIELVNIESDDEYDEVAKVFTEMFLDEEE